MANSDDTETPSGPDPRPSRQRRQALPRRMVSAAAGAVLVASCLTVSAPARGDWLVLQSGDQVETRGSWRVEGRRIIFTSTRGVLSSVRLSTVDVEASRAFTERKAEEAAQVEEEVEVEARREPVLILTDEDIAPARPAPAADGEEPGREGEGGVEPPQAAAVPSSDPLENRTARQLPGSPSIQVLDWSVRPTGENETSILGYVQNTGSYVATTVSLTVTLRDSDGVEIVRVPAELSSSAIMPGTQAFYEATFTDGFNFAEVEFEAESVDLEVAEEQGAEGESLAGGQLREEGGVEPQTP